MMKPMWFHLMPNPMARDTRADVPGFTLKLAAA
jgi:hypothetical protein